MTLFGKTILKHKILLEGLTNKYHGKLIPVSTAIEVASRAMNFQTAYDFESCLGVMQKAFDVNDGYFVDSASVAPVEELKAEIYKLKHQSEQGFGNHDYYVGYISALSTVEGILAWMDEKE